MSLVVLAAPAAAVALAVGFPIWATYRLPVIAERARTRHDERAVTHRQRLYLRLLHTGRKVGPRGARTDRALHNDFDDACTYWWGDRRPETNDP